MSMTETPVGDPIRSAPESTEKRHRASTAEMDERKQRAIEVAQNSTSPVTLEQIREALGLNPPTAVALVRSLLDEGRLVVRGKNGRRLLLGVGRGKKGTTIHSAPQTVAAVREPKPRASSINVNDILAQLHIGAEYEMVGLKATKDNGVTIDLVEKTPGARVITVALAR